MSAPRIGSLCSGYGGLDRAVEAVIPDAELAWVSDIDKGACKVLAHRYPDVPNLGDMTTVEWASVEPVDILTGGTPCQDLSHAGKRAGMTAGARSNLWVAMREAIAVLRPSLVIWENVGGAYSACADSELGRCPRCVDPDSTPGHAPRLRALGRVLGDLASLGFDAEWHGIRAADIGAPHGRLRVFVAAYAQRGGLNGWARTAGRGAVGGAAAYGRVEGSLLPTPRVSSDRTGRLAAIRRDSRSGPSLGQALEIAQGSLPREFHSWNELPASWQPTTLLPTPAVNDMGSGKTVEAWDEWTAKMRAKHGNGNGHGKSLAIELQRVESGWGPYAAAVERWEQITGRSAPPPSEPVLVREWMMGLPAGWITDVPGITRNEALKLAGNGVVWQQAAAALRIMLARAEDVAA